MYILGYSGFTRNSFELNGIRNSFAKTNQTFDNLFEFREGEVPFSLFPLGYFGHDASAALIKDGEIIACASEERFTRLKFSLNLLGNTLLPKNAIDFCLKEAGISIYDIDAIAHYCSFNEVNISERVNLLRPYITEDAAEKVSNSYFNIYREMMSRDIIREQFSVMTGRLPDNFLQVKHHMAHSASAYYPSGLDPALIFTLDGTGELESSTVCIGEAGEIKEISSDLLPTSLGALYLIITMFLGFKSLGDEYKVMGLASYGNPSGYRSVFDKLLQIEPNGIYTTACITDTGLKEILISNLGFPRKNGDAFEKRHADIAAALQESLNIAVLHKLKYYQSLTGLKNLCMAGGVALNCTMNGVIAKTKSFKNIFIQPASSDEGCSVGAAYYALRKLSGQKIKPLKWENVYYGPAYKDDDILMELENFNHDVTWEYEKDIAYLAAEEIAAQKVIGWFQGRMEFGPRALGNRSILASPVNPSMKDIINEKVKRREAFRPFAPAVIEEEADNYFELCGQQASPYMLFALDVKNGKKEIIPAVTHVDGTARVQTVSKKSNPLFWKLIDNLRLITGIPVVLNTSFNVKNEPIVCSPKDAVKCFLSTNIDVLVIGNYYVQKKANVNVQKMIELNRLYQGAVNK